MDKYSNTRGSTTSIPLLDAIILWLQSPQHLVKRQGINTTALMTSHAARFTFFCGVLGKSTVKLEPHATKNYIINHRARPRASTTFTSPHAAPNQPTPTPIIVVEPSPKSHRPRPQLTADTSALGRHQQFCPRATVERGCDFKQNRFNFIAFLQQINHPGSSSIQQSSATSTNTSTALRASRIVRAAA